MGSTKALVGYDCEFISETPDYIMCSICHLVMRDPVLIITCGHKFCQPCYERMKVYFTDRSMLFCCPVDRDVIDQSKVCEDAGLRRAIGNLSIKCPNAAAGCTWQGDLSEAEVHQSSCGHNRPEEDDAQAMQGYQSITDGRLKELKERAEKCDQEICELKRMNRNLEAEVVRLNKCCEDQKNDYEDERIHNSIQREVAKKEMRFLKNALINQGIINRVPQVQGGALVQAAGNVEIKNKKPPHMLANIPWVTPTQNAEKLDHSQASSQVAGGSTPQGVKRGQKNTTNKKSKKVKTSPLTQ